MPDGVTILFITCICLLSALYEYNLFSSIRSAYSRYTISAKIPIVLLCVIKAGVLVAAMLLKLPLFVMYPLFYLLYLILFQPFTAVPWFPFWFWTNLRFIHFAASHMICLAVLSLINGLTMYDALHNQMIWLLSMFLTTWLQMLIIVILKKVVPAEGIQILSADLKRVRQLTVFETFSVGYLFFDSVMCMFSLSYMLIPLFVIGSSVLLVAQLYLFLRHTYRIVQDSHYEKEYYELELQRQKHIRSEMELRSLAYRDTLTGVCTRRYAIELLNSALADGRKLVLVCIDLNGLKKVNDRLGHPEGDRYLISVSDALKRKLKLNDILARMGGDEFLIIAQETTAAAMKERVEDAVAELANLRRDGYVPSFSYGITEVAEGETPAAEDLLRLGDQRMYEHKIATTGRAFAPICLLAGAEGA